MKILYHHRIGSKDGQYVHIREMIDALQQLGHEVVVVGASGIAGQSFGGESRRITSLKRYMPKPLYEVLELAYSLRDYLRLRRVIRDQHPDFIYERYNLYFVSGVRAHRRFGLPLLVEVNAPLLDERSKYGGLALKSLARWSERLVWRSADHVFAVTRVLAKRIAVETHDDDRISVTPNGINMASFGNLPGRSEAKARLGRADGIVLGFTGFVRQWHGLERIIDLVAGRLDLPLHLIVVGDGPARKQLEERASSHGIAERVTFCGLVARKRIPEYVAAFDIAVQPNVVPYASPLKLFEYMAARCAIVAPDTDNIREILQDEANALLFPVDAVDALARQVGRLVEDAALRQKLGAAARKTLEDRDLTWQHNAREVVAVAQRLLDRQPATDGAATTRRLPREPSR